MAELNAEFICSALTLAGWLFSALFTLCGADADRLVIVELPSPIITNPKVQRSLS